MRSPLVPGAVVVLTCHPLGTCTETWWLLKRLQLMPDAAEPVPLGTAHEDNKNAINGSRTNLIMTGVW